MPVTPKQTSFSTLFVKVEFEDEVEIFDIWDVYEVIARYKGQSSFFYTYLVPENQRLDKIANDFYGTPTLWWFILVFNEIIDPFTAIEKDTELRLIRPEFVQEIIYAIKQAKLRR